MATKTPKRYNPRPKAGEHRRDNLPVKAKEDATHRWYYCQFKDCPKPKTLMKVLRKRAGRPPTYHVECKAALKAIRVARDGTPDGRPRIGDGDSLSPRTPEDRARLDMQICGAERRGSVKGKCCMPAGWGTDHLGHGSCKLHMGSTPAGSIHGFREKMFKESIVLGNEIVIDPHTAVLQEIHRTAGHVEWLRMLIGAMGVDPNSFQAEVIGEETGLIAKGISGTLSQFTEKGIAPSVWIEMYQKERTHLVRTCKMAVDMGCAERTVMVAESQGRMIAAVMQKIFTRPELQLTNAQKAALGPIVRQEMLALEAETTSTKEQAPA